MIKRTLFAGMAIAVMAGSATLATRAEPVKAQDTHIILELDRANTSLTAEGIENNQNQVLNNIRKYVTSNFRVVSSYSEIANAVAISVNSEDIDLIKNVPGVKSVTLNKLHWQSVTTMDNEEDEPSEDVKKKHYYGDDTNQSAKTMEKPDSSYDGEGTVIAILDNEFYLKGVMKDGTGGWNHEVFTALGEDVAVKHKGAPTSRLSTHAYKWAKDKNVYNSTLGREGSFYFNSKVPFYFDYGGETTSYGDEYKEDLDVVSDVSYHGSHVASIASANADKYKGIAPKAQLACMKVFTNYKASAADQKIGLSSSSGAYDIPILNALEDCMLLKVDGINMSLGSDLDDFDQGSITMKTLTKLAESGILTSISAGNAGKASYASTGAYANWTTNMVETGILGSYANNAAATIIAAGQPDQVFYASAFKMDLGEGVFTNIAYDDQIVNREHSDIEYSTEYKMEDLVPKDNPDKKLDWVYVKGFGNSSDYEKLDVKGKVAITNRGSITFKQKYDTAISEGAIAVGIINNDPTATDFNFSFSFGDDFAPTAPCVHILYKDKATFERLGTGQFQIISNEVAKNDMARTISSFSSDGTRFDLDMKPDITAPGENIRGAIPPQNKDDKKYYQFNTYEFLSGTSMSAPNYAGAQSVVLSNKTGPIYEKYLGGNKSPSKAELEEIAKYRNTVDMRLMSTASPMRDPQESPEQASSDAHVKAITSPRRQGAGMVNLTGALSTDVYLEGLDLQGSPIGKSKIALRNNNDINNGKIALSFMAHNESEENRRYEASISVMRPAIAKNNDIITKDFNNRGEVESKEYIYGLTYWTNDALPGVTPIPKEQHGSSGFELNDAIYVSKDIEYYASYNDVMENNVSVFKQGRYYVSAVTKDDQGNNVGATWSPIPEKTYQSVMNKMIEEKVVLNSELVIPAGDNKITLNSYDLTAEAKAQIAELFEYGCYIEGYLTLKSLDEKVDLSMPYMGFYAGPEKTYESAPVVEPFAFEKEDNKVYPSDLVNDLAISLIGKDNIDMGSNWVAGYVEPGESYNYDDILTNDKNLTMLTGFHQIGTDPKGEKTTDLYVGNPYYTNTMLVQQFVLRSVKDNYFTITRKSDGKEVYRSALKDMLFGAGTFNDWELYKSHVDNSYLAAGYVAHRAYAQIPLFDETTGVPFSSGDYTIKFNYLLASTSSWVDKSYTLHIDSAAPVVKSIQNRANSIRININENKLSSAVVDRYIYNFEENGDGKYYIDIPKADLEQYLEDNINYGIGSGRLYIKLTDAAYGTTGVIVRFEDNGTSYNFNKYVIVQYHSLTLQNDFLDDGENITLLRYDSVTEYNTEIKIDDYVRVIRGESSAEPKGCSGNIWTTSIILSSIAFAGIVTLILSRCYKKKDSEGGK